MTVKLRKGIYWSDGVEFTADDLIYTVDTHKKTAGMTYTGQFQANVDTVTKTDNYTVVFKLLKVRILASTPTSPCAGAPAS